jgi:RNA polymerase sigma-70 factor, ECF subfamily
METPQTPEVTGLLQAWSAGNEDALTKLTPLVYRELHQMARRHMAQERASHTLQASALVNEVYLRLVRVRGVTWQNRAHFFAICARTMRRILINFARSRRYKKRGGDAVSVTLTDALGLMTQPTIDLIALDHALNGLARLDARKSQVVELRFFGGLSVDETAEVLKISAETVMRDWKFAKVWLGRELNGGKA